ncbi:MAG: hemerythrin domain-containing protein [Candidatus Pacearchaeota archaeon]
MNPIEVLKEQHEEIDMELMEIESVISENEINYSNLIHSFVRLCKLWDNHEKKEDKIFSIMEKERILMPVYTMTCEHKTLREHINKIKEAINSGSDLKLKDCFDKDLKKFIEKIRAHKNSEDEVLYTIALEEFTTEELEEMGKALE